MKKKIILLLLLLVGSFFFAGCHTCPPYEESKECFPLCKEDRKENLLLTQENWEKFKQFRHIPYRNVNLPLLDRSGRIISRLSRQIVDEIIIPYVELDKDNLIQIYYQFVADVKAVQDRQDCTLEKASELAWQDWLNQPGGAENCAKLQRAIPFIVNMRAENQIPKALVSVGDEVTRLLLALPADIKQLIGEARTVIGWIKISLAGAQITRDLTRLSIASSYLYVLKADASEQEQQIENFVAKLNSEK